MPSICSYCNRCQTLSLCSPQSVGVSRFALVAPPPAILEWLVILSSSSTLGACMFGCFCFFECGAFSRPHGWFQLQWPPTWLSVNIATKEFVPVVMAAALRDNLAEVSIHNKRSANDPLLSFSLPFISFTSLPNIFMAFQTLLSTLCLVTIFTSWSHRCCRPLSHPPFKSSSYSRHPTGPHLVGPVCFVSPCPGTCFLHTCNI